MAVSEVSANISTESKSFGSGIQFPPEFILDQTELSILKEEYYQALG